MNPILFLDIDGVINPIIPKIVDSEDPTLATKLSKFNHNSDIEKLDLKLVTQVYYGFDHQACSYIKKLCESLNAKIIVTSSWRLFYSFHQLQAILDIHGLGKYVIHKTPDLYKREKEINHIIQLFQIKNYVVIDDIDMKKTFKKRMIHTKDIFSQSHYQQAYKQLSQ